MPIASPAVVVPRAARIRSKSMGLATLAPFREKRGPDLTRPYHWINTSRRSSSDNDEDILDDHDINRHENNVANNGGGFH